MLRWQRAPDIAHESKYLWFGPFELTGNEGEEIIFAKVAFGHFGEEFLLVDQAVVLAIDRDR